MRRFVSKIESLLFVLAAIALGYCAYVLIESRLYRDRAMHELESLSQPAPETSSPESANVSPGKRAAPKPVVPREGTPIGEIVIPRLGVSEVVLEGTQERTLRLSVGHVTGTAEPGNPGNICIAGHRDTFFRPLRNIIAGDTITINFPGGSTEYRVEKAWVVDPKDVEVLNATSTDELTLITCYPFYFIGSAPRRFVVRAKAVKREGQSQQDHRMASFQ